MALRVLVAPSGFKESLEAEQVAECIEEGVLRVVPDAEISKAPMVDGGEGFTKTLVNATGGTLHEVTVTGPVGEPVESYFGILGGAEGTPRVAVLEMAAAAGLRLVPRDLRDPSGTTTYGVGELIRAALDAGADCILVGCGDSGTTDGGAGMAQALGVRLLDRAGNELDRGGAELARLDSVDLSGRDPRLDSVPIEVACNWHNVLCGPRGVARVFGPQKGATPEAVEKLDAALENYAAVIREQVGVDARQMPGGGASGGLGTGLQALVGATLHPRYEIVSRYLEIESLLEKADLVFTAEGGIDFQTPRGKIPVEIARRAKRYGLPVVAIVGTVGKDAQINHDHGIDAYVSILQAPVTLDQAIEQACDLVTVCAEDVMRLVMLGRELAPASPSGFGEELRPEGAPAV
ncbi:glycerate kinase [Rubrobacter marinus]|uniref:Glycerate kinase n=1 Tax=Rubrobacter marinus TaxID=2653852 RepID=A0A6G8Q2B4_9ACTN|nr:glycerate kinase [Rubrobacter marinus]QIN80457.1 glycerate kinase [Rubrobacter marinus]